MKLHAKQQGVGADVISLHGLFGTQENLGGINRILANHFRVHSLDVRNHGRSPHADEMDYDHMAADIVEYMDDHRLDTVDLVGHSMGGKIAMAVALQEPERIRKLVVMDIAPVTYERKHDSVLEGLSSIDLTLLTKRSDADNLLAPYIEEMDIRQFLIKNLQRDASRQYQWRMNLRSIHQNYHEIMKGQLSDQPFEGAVLFLKASESDYILPEHRQQVISLFPNANVRIIKDVGHWLHAQKPELISRCIERFLAS